MGPKRPRQLVLELLPKNGWGGARAGAGRKAAGAEAGIAHRSREALSSAPVHVTVSARPGAPSLRSPRVFAVVAAALRGLLDREDFRLVHYSVQTSHVHLVAEADDAKALGSAMRALSIRLTLRMNALLGTRGRFLADRYHAHVLRTPTEVRRAVAYVLGNYASHARRRGDPVPDGYVDPCSSAAPVGLDGLPPAVKPPRTWLLSSTTVREPEAEYDARDLSPFKSRCVNTSRRPCRLRRHHGGRDAGGRGRAGDPRDRGVPRAARVNVVAASLRAAACAGGRETRTRSTGGTASSGVSRSELRPKAKRLGVFPTAQLLGAYTR